MIGKAIGNNLPSFNGTSRLSIDRTYSGCTPIHSRVTTGMLVVACDTEAFGEFEGLPDDEKEGRVPRATLAAGEPTLSFAYTID